MINDVDEVESENHKKYIQAPIFGSDDEDDNEA